MKIEYALYKGDKYLFGGTIKELAKYLGVKEHTIRFYSTPCYLKRIKDRKSSYEVIKVEGIGGSNG